MIARPSARAGMPLWPMLATALLYYVGARLGYAFVIQPAGAAFWPPAGLLLGMLLLRPRREWPWLLAAGASANLLADLGNGNPPSTLFIAAAANAVESLAAAWTVERLAGRHVTLRSVREVVALIVGAVLVSNAVTAFAGSFVMMRGYEAGFWWGWFIWWAGDGLGMLLFTPMLVVWGRTGAFRRLRPRAVAEAVLLLALLVGVASLVIAPEDDTPRLVESTRNLIFPLLFLIAIRHGLRGAASAILVVGATVAWEGSRVTGVFARAGEPPSQQLIEVWQYLGLVALSSLVPAAVFSEREVARRHLRASERRFREMAERIEEAFFVVDLAATRPLYVSPAWGRIWGRPASAGYDLVNWYSAVHPEDAARVQEARAVIRGGRPHEISFRLVRPDGEVRWATARTYPVADERGTVLRIVGVIQDVTDLRSAEDRQSRSQRMEALGRLAGGVAHDFNNVLTVILGEAGFLYEDLRDTPHAETIGEIRSAAQRAAGMTRQLLAFSRQQVVAPTSFDLNAAVGEMSGMLRRLIPENVALDFRASASPCPVEADRGQLEQVIVNLVVNARDAMPDGGTLSLTTELAVVEEPMAAAPNAVPPGRYATLSVADTGVGMTEAVRARLFEPFFTTKAPGSGTGLGLATSYGIIARAGGQFTVYSEPGLGSTFRIYLPLGTTGSASPTPSEGAPTHAGGHETVLLVEDDAAVRRVSQRLLRSLGYTVLTASDGPTALRLLEEGADVDLLLADVVLPGMGGREIAERVAMLRPDLPVLFASGYTEDVILQQRLLIEGAALLRKPFTRETLARKVRATLDRR